MEKVWEYVSVSEEHIGLYLESKVYATEVLIIILTDAKQTFWNSSVQIGTFSMTSVEQSSKETHPTLDILCLGCRFVYEDQMSLFYHVL